MKITGNILWLVFGGFTTAMEFFAAGIALMVTIIGIPFGLQTLKPGMLELWPFGKTIVPE